MKWEARCSGMGRSPYAIRGGSEPAWLVARFGGLVSRRLTMRQVPGPVAATLDPRFFSLLHRFDIRFRDGSQWHFRQLLSTDLIGRLSGPGGDYDVLGHPGVTASVVHQGRKVAHIRENRLQWGNETVLDVESDDDVDADRFVALLACYLACEGSGQGSLLALNLGRLIGAREPGPPGWTPRRKP